MKIAIIEKSGKNKIMDVLSIPNVGDKVDLFYYPYPVVICVLYYPSAFTLQNIGLTDQVTAIVTVE